jgi:hypothetical protein
MHLSLTALLYLFERRWARNWVVVSLPLILMILLKVHKEGARAATGFIRRTFAYRFPVDEDGALPVGTFFVLPPSVPHQGEGGERRPPDGSLGVSDLNLIFNARGVCVTRCAVVAKFERVVLVGCRVEIEVADLEVARR